MIRPSMNRGLAACGGVWAILAALLVSVPAAAGDVCHFVEVQCDRASKAVRIVPFGAADEECARLRALKDADWLVDVARHVRSGRGQMAPGQPKIVKCDLGEGRSVTALVQGSPVGKNTKGRCGSIFSAIVTIDEQQPASRRVLNELSVIDDCDTGGAADQIEYFIDQQKLLVQWTPEPQFGTLERTVLARKYLSETSRGGR